MNKHAVFLTKTLVSGDGWVALSASRLIGDFSYSMSTSVSLRRKGDTGVAGTFSTASVFSLKNVDLSQIEVSTASSGSIYVHGTAGSGD